MTPEQKQKHLSSIEKIEFLPRPEKWYEARKLLFDLHPELIQLDADHRQACKELRQALTSSTASSKSLSIRNLMKIPNYVYQVLGKLDPEAKEEMSGKKPELQEKFSKELYMAFPEYRIARSY